MAKFIILGVLMEIPRQPERCGDNAVAVVFKFAVEQVLDGDVDQELILAAIPCPELKGEGYFIKNARYRVQAETDSSTAGEYSIYNEYENEGLEMCWCEGIEKVSP
jgi:hypothetical protein